jgi:hypothetical protein
MPDPFTIGALAAWALSKAAEGIAKGVLGEAAKDAYKSLKNRIAQWADHDVAALEAMPGSEAQKAVLAKGIDQRTEQDKESLRGALELLVAGLKENAPAIGLDIGTLTNIETHLRKIDVTQGIGLRMKEASGGKLEVDELHVGPSPAVTRPPGPRTKK